MAHSRTRTVAATLRLLNGQNKARLVRTADGQYFVRKLFTDASGSDRLFNEAFASRLGRALELPFPRYSELVDELAVSCRSSFGSELISGDILECLPGSCYQHIQNRHDVFRCLLFDMWCNHIDPRQAIFQMRSQRLLHVYFIDHDLMFSTQDQSSLSKCIARTRYLDPRIYTDPPTTLFRDLQLMAHDITILAEHDLTSFAKSVPASWGTSDHRKHVVAGLNRRVGQLTSYIEAIMEFVNRRVPVTMQQRNSA